MGRTVGGKHGHKLSDYIKLNEKPDKRTKQYKSKNKKLWNDIYIGKTDDVVRYNR